MDFVIINYLFINLFVSFKPTFIWSSKFDICPVCLQLKQLFLSNLKCSVRFCDFVFITIINYR